jgi:2-isopropylmalate synthase
MAALDAGASHVQGTVNGYGERTGNADLLTVVSNLQLKAGREVVEPARLRDAMRLAHAISEVTNVPPYSRQPYVGSSAFAHKAGLHASALRVDPDLYQHTDPAAVGNSMRTLVSDMAGRASIQLKAAEVGIDLAGLPNADELVADVLRTVKELELRGYTFDAADASFELLLRNAVSGTTLAYFDVESWRVITDARGADLATSEATVKLVASERRFVATGEGNGPVNALDHALRQALTAVYPEIEKLQLIDFRVRILDADQGTDAVTRVLIETSDGETSWDTVGVAPNIVEASWRALVDGITFGLMRHGVPVR